MLGEMSNDTFGQKHGRPDPADARRSRLQALLFSVWYALSGIADVVGALLEPLRYWR